MTSRSRTRPRVAAGHARRTRPVRRSSAGLTRVRSAALLALLASGAAIYGVGAAPAFGFATLDLSGMRYTDEAAVRSRLDIQPGTNLFGLATEPLEARLLELPTVTRASVSVELPATLSVEVAERSPILVWQIGERRHLVDRDGRLFAELGARPTDEARSLPVVDDRRATSTSLAVGMNVDPVDLDAATRLGSLRPTDVGSAARGLRVELTDDNGYVVRAEPSGWTAVFGFYTPSLRTPDMIPGQVQLLRSLLLEEGERNVVRVTLASETDGTFTTPRPEPTPEPTPEP